MVDVAAVAFMSRNLNQPQKFHRFETVAVSTRAQGLENVRDGLCAALFVQVEHQDERNVVPDEDVLAPLLLQMAQSSFVNSTRVQAVFTMPDYIWFGALHPHVQHMLSDPQSAAQVRVLGPAQYKADTLNVLGSSVTYVEGNALNMAKQTMSSDCLCSCVLSRGCTSCSPSGVRTHCRSRYPVDAASLSTLVHWVSRRQQVYPVQSAPLL